MAAGSVVTSDVPSVALVARWTLASAGSAVGVPAPALLACLAAAFPPPRRNALL